MTRFYYGPGGALVADRQVPGAQKLEPNTAAHYGGVWFIGETLSRRMAGLIAEVYGGELCDEPFVKPETRPCQT